MKWNLLYRWLQHQQELQRKYKRNYIYTLSRATHNIILFTPWISEDTAQTSYKTKLVGFVVDEQVFHSNLDHLVSIPFIVNVTFWLRNDSNCVCVYVCDPENLLR